MSPMIIDQNILLIEHLLLKLALNEMIRTEITTFHMLKVVISEWAVSSIFEIKPSVVYVV